MERVKVTKNEYENALKRVKEIYVEKRNLLFEIEFTRNNKDLQKTLFDKKKMLDKEYAKNKVLIRTYEIENNIEKEEKENDKHKRK